MLVMTDPFFWVELVRWGGLLFFLPASLVILFCFAPRIVLGMGRETWCALFWTSGGLTAIGFLPTLQHVGILRALLSVPFLFITWALTLLPVFCLGAWLRRRRHRQREADGTPEPGDEDGPQDG